MRMRSWLIGACAVLVGTVHAYAQTTYYVDPACGDNSWSGLSRECGAPEGPFETLTQALETAADGDEIVLLDGIYTSGAVVRPWHVGLTIRSENGPDACILTSDAIITVQGERIVIDGLSFVGIERPLGAAAILHASGADDLQIRGCRFAENSAETDGLAIRISDRSTNITIDGCLFERNALDFGNGGALSLESPNVVVSDCLFSGNQAVSGGAIWLDEPALIRRCTFLNNIAIDGGAIMCQGPWVGSDPLQLVDCIFSSNVAAADGGGVFSQSCEVILSGCAFTENSAISAGGGTYVFSGGFQADACTWSRNISLTPGGGISAIASDLDLAECQLTDNQSFSVGGGISLVGSDAGLEAMTVLQNGATDSGGGVYCQDSGLAVVNSILWGNISPGGSQLAVRLSSVPTVTQSNVQGGQSNVLVDSSSGLSWGPGNMDVDPLFEDPSTGDYRLSSGSPCIDAGDNALVTSTLDRDGNPRMVDDTGMPDTGEGTAPIVDVGCYERQEPTTDFVIVRPVPGIAGEFNTLQAAGATPGGTVYFVWSTSEGTTEVPGCPGVNVELRNPTIAGSTPADQSGYAAITNLVPIIAADVEVFLQAVEPSECAVTRVVRYRF